MTAPKEIKKVVDHQANLVSLWAEPVGRKVTMHESMLMAALRHLHAVIEGDVLMAKIMKQRYWHIEDEL
jgi:hypothetical protein